jgi:murein DD-endopeptidase MepM/ murein hydrolase activator NlpD
VLRVRTPWRTVSPTAGWRLPAGERRPIRRSRPVATLTIVLVAALAVPAAVTARPKVDTGTPAVSVSPDFRWELPTPPPSEPEPAPEPAPPPAPELPVFAHARGLPLTQVSTQVRAVGYHQAGRSTRAVPMTAVTPGITSAPPGKGPWGLVQPSRRRGTDRAGAVDLALPADVPVHSPVTGRVVKVERYRLYRRIPDIKVTIVPDARPHAEVVLLHVARVPVKPGDRVVAGQTVVAKTARPLPLRSTIERYSGRMPHVHVEVRPSSTVARKR